MKSILFNILLITCSTLFYSCDHGLAPPPKEKIVQGIQGTIYYKGTLIDTLKEHRLIASKVFRKFRDIGEIINLVFTTDSIQIYPSLTLSPLTLSKTDSIQYIFVLPPGIYKYIAVVQARSNAAIYSNWKIVGVYDLDITTIEPTEVQVHSGEFKSNINIHVDYDNPPPQPFENVRLK